TGVAELVLIWGVGQQIHRFLIRSLFICRAASEVQTLERIYIGEKETVSECQLGVDAMTKRDMSKLMGLHHSKCRLIQTNVVQAMAAHTDVYNVSHLRL